MRFTIFKLAALASLASLMGLADANLATECMDTEDFTEVTLSSPPNDIIGVLLDGVTCPDLNVIFNEASSEPHLVLVHVHFGRRAYPS
jgi:hypothetical protein